MARRIYLTGLDSTLQAVCPSAVAADVCTACLSSADPFPLSSSASDPPPPLQIQLTAEETQGAAATTEQELLQLVEMLVQAGAPCNRFLTEHWPAAAAAAGAACLAGAASTTACVAGAAGPAGTATMNGQRPPALVFPSLLLAAGLPSWSPRAHRQWPPAFCSAAREALLVLRGRGVAAAAERAGGGQTHMQRGGAAGQHVQLHLPVEICHLVLQKAASAVSCWVGP